jgi:hypothetical protein
MNTNVIWFILLKIQAQNCPKIRTKESTDIAALPMLHQSFLPLHAKDYSVLALLLLVCKLAVPSTHEALNDK